MTPSAVARRALPAVIAGVLALGGAAAAQDQPPEPPGTAKIGTISASPFGSSIFVEVQCPAEGNDCQGDLSARTTSRVRAPGSRTPRRVPIDTTSYSVPKGQVARRQLSNPKAVCLHLRHTGRLGVEITLTVDTEGTSGPPVEPQVTTTVVRAPRKPKAKCKSWRPSHVARRLALLHPARRRALISAPSYAVGSCSPRRRPTIQL